MSRLDAPETAFDANRERVLLSLRQHEAAGTADPEATRLADRIFPGWRTEHPAGDRFLTHLFAVIDFRAEHGRLPKQREPDGKWLWHPRGGRGIIPERQALLERELPGWDQRKRDPQPFADHLATVKAFRADHGRLPKYSEPEGKWLDNCRTGNVKITPERRALLDRELPGWDQRKWYPQPFADRISAVKAFRAKSLRRLVTRRWVEVGWARGLLITIV